MPDDPKRMDDSCRHCGQRITVLERDLHALERLMREWRIGDARDVILAKEVADRWHQDANNWRATMVERERTFWPRSLGLVTAMLSLVALVISLLGQIR